jgi:YHS domain-containing protein
MTILLISTISWSQKSAIFEVNGKAIRGYDAVAYFISGEPVMGFDSLSVVWNNSTWCFSSEANRELFKKDPEHYAPQYGGYCAYGTADGHKAPTQSDAWAIVNGKLYFNYNKKVKSLWDKDQQGFIEKADKNWPLIKDKE